MMNNNSQTTSNNNQNKKFNVVKFNTEFEKEKEENKILQNIKEEERLRILNAQPEEKKIWENNLYDILVGIKNTWFNIIDDLLQQNFVLDTFTKQNRLFYMGLTFMIIGIIIYCYNYFTYDETNEYNNRDNTVVKNYYVYNRKYM